MVAFAIASIAAGFFVGVLSGLLGIGGGTILVSIFSLVFGMGAINATATSLFTIIPTSLSGAITHIREKTSVAWIGAAAGVGGAIMSPIGVWLASISPGWLIIVCCAGVIVYSAVSMFMKGIALWNSTRGGSDRRSDLEELEAEELVEIADDTTSALPPSPTPKLVVQAAAIGLVAGLLSGYVGLGGGFLMVPLFMSALGLPMVLASGTSLVAILIIAIPGTVTQAILGNVDWLVGIAVSIGSIPGVVIGSKLVKKVPELWLRFGFGAFLLVVAALLVIEQFI